ncbi:unnamed protein product [Moneuplotes crassus]|uniref:RING-type domain-containing protein n=1 Tax=Euplotes crassus TaxID=5936 RepID=A0AAD1UFD4_EUPCR|nr:unnamed protein product [Moneuplotes crassus]
MDKISVNDLSKVIEYAHCYVKDCGTLSSLVCGILLGKNITQPDKAIEKVLEMNQLSVNIGLTPEKEIIMHSTQTLKNCTQENEHMKMLLSTKLESQVQLGNNNHKNSGTIFEQAQRDNSRKMKRFQKEKDKELGYPWHKNIKVETSNPNMSYAPMHTMYPDYTRPIDNTHCSSRAGTVDPNLNGSLIDSDSGGYVDGKMNVSKQNATINFKNMKFGISSNSQVYNKTPLDYPPTSSSEEGQNEESSYKCQVSNRSQKRQNSKRRARIGTYKSRCSICQKHLTKSPSVKNSDCHHWYHNECLQEYIKGKIEQYSFPFRCPIRACTRKLGRTNVGKVIQNPTDLEKFDILNLLNRVEKGKKVFLWCKICDYLFTLPRYDVYKCLKCYQMSLKVKSMLEDTVKKFKKPNLKEDPLFTKMYNKCKQEMQRCFKCYYWIQDIPGCENFKCRCKDEDKTDSKEPSTRDS